MHAHTHMSLKLSPCTYPITKLYITICVISAPDWMEHCVTLWLNTGLIAGIHGVTRSISAAKGPTAFHRHTGSTDWTLSCSNIIVCVHMETPGGLCLSRQEHNRSHLQWSWSTTYVYTPQCNVHPLHDPRTPYWSNHCPSYTERCTKTTSSL